MVGNARAGKSGRISQNGTDGPEVNIHCGQSVGTWEPNWPEVRDTLELAQPAYLLKGGTLKDENGPQASGKKKLATNSSDAQSTEEKQCSERKLLANRANASKSTGPRSARGKSFSAQNAFKHGALADPMLITDVDNKAMFLDIVMRLRRARKPKDIVDEIFVLEAAKAFWRMGRADIAERAEIEKAMYREVNGPLVDPASASSFIRARELMMEGASKLLAFFEQADAEIAAKGVASSELINTVQRSFPHAKELQDAFRHLLSNRVGPDNLTADLSAKLQALALLQKYRQAAKVGRAALAEEKEHEWTLDRERQLVPSTLSAQNIVRYRTTHFRQFVQAIQELDRIQKSRKGKTRKKLSPDLKKRDS